VRCLAALVIVVSPGCFGPVLIRADDMSAKQHRDQARLAQEAASRAEGRIRSGPELVQSTGEPPAYDPDEGHRREVRERREHARQHAAAAAFLEQFEDEACVLVPRESRAACPLLGPLERLDDIPGGVRAVFTQPARAKSAVVHMRCQYAFARARHFDENTSCPLYVQGVEIRRGVDPSWVEILSRDERTMTLIRERSRERAIYVRATTPGR
jgi:hypothetical protein